MVEQLPNMSSDAPAVSVIMNGLNCAKYLPEAIDSVFAQTYTDWEIIFWDNCSTDNSAEIAQSYGSKLRYFKSDKTATLGKARNWAMEQAKGKYIAFLDCDDIWLPTKLEEQIPLFEKNPKVGLVFCDVIIFKRTEDLYCLYRKAKPYRGMVFKELLSGYFLGMQAVVIRKETLSNLDSWFDDNLAMAEEMDLFLRIAYSWEIDYVDKPLAKWRMHTENESQKMKHLIPKEKEIILEKLSNLYPNFETKYTKEIETQRKIIAYQWALAKWKDKSAKEARKHLRPYLFVEKKFLLSFMLSIFPYPFYDWLRGTYLNFKYGK